MCHKYHKMLQHYQSIIRIKKVSTLLFTYFLLLNRVFKTWKSSKSFLYSVSLISSYHLCRSFVGVNFTHSFVNNSFHSVYHVTKLHLIYFGRQSIWPDLKRLDVYPFYCRFRTLLLNRKYLFTGRRIYK